MKLAVISASDPVTALALRGLAESAPILNDLEFYPKSGASDAVKKARTGTTATITRALNASNSAPGPTPVYDPIAKKIVSFDAKADVVLEDRNEDPETELAYQTRLEAQQAGYALQEMFFEGDSSAEGKSADFDGLRKIIPVGNVKAVATDGLVLELGNADAKIAAQQAAVEELLKLFRTVRGGATHAFMNEFLKIRLLTIAKNLGYYRLSKDELGNDVEQIGSVAIRGAGYKADGTTLLPMTETQGAATSKCGSIFVCRMGERIDLTALTSVGVKGRYAGQVGNCLVNNINLDMALVLQNTTALVQSKGWRLV